MIYRCVKSFDVDKFETEECSGEPIGISTIEKCSLWEMRDNSGDYEVMLDNCDDAEWLGISKELLKSNFERVE